MVERLIEYRRKCKILKQIQSNKALANKNFSFAQSLITVFVSALLTFFGFSGLDKIKLYILIVANKEVTIDSVGMFFNILVFLLFFMGIVQMIFQFNTKQTSSEKAIQQLSTLINDIDNILENPCFTIKTDIVERIADKYTLITQTMPTNTDKEYLRAKKSLLKKDKKTSRITNSTFSMTEKDEEAYLTRLLQSNLSIHKIITVISEIEIEELYLGGGVIRNLLWDHLHGYIEQTPIDDVDVVYYNSSAVGKEFDSRIEFMLKARVPNLTWSVKNQARMHIFNNDVQYQSLYDAISKWPETASAIVVRRDTNGKYKFIAPYGFHDLFNLIVQPTPYFKDKIEKYLDRVNSKKWVEKWPKLSFLDVESFLANNINRS